MSTVTQSHPCCLTFWYLIWVPSQLEWCCSAVPYDYSFYHHSDDQTKPALFPLNPIMPHTPLVYPAKANLADSRPVCLPSLVFFP